MLRYAIGRLALLVFTLFLLTLFVFALMRLAPGNPAALLLQGIGAVPDESLIALYEHKWGLDQSFVQQYVTWLLELLQGHLGSSFVTGQPVTKEIASRLQPTLLLIASSFIVTVLFSVPLGIVSAIRENTLLDRIVYGGSVLGLSVPLYWLAILLMLGFGVLWPLFPIIGSGSANHYVLPVAAISLIQGAYFVRMIRSFTLEYKHSFFMEAARARGLRRRILYPSYLLRSMLIPVLTVVGTSFSGFFGAAVMIENVFSFPGLGTYMLDMIYNRDFPAIQGCSLLVAAVIFVLNFVTDLGYYAADPRVRLDKQRWEL
ncbi:ABC transporter permease [Paenibacillus radicis (ex Gao et al. 2016)]|uniref:Peptide ABC transporter permease n=1 Tax=Paenibacillus radicis (ex Gao et al. 2016) TaxID=1737354 RepID=A0A917LXW0_9BACL|nr:ABC transporter permease [Paenibacillus radicis (ex Gao et al. 2016)]GGG65036.1 peptide ABC transporter permease [Paenibacillus radicis (ex Gao et al. 2016)]